MTTNTQQSKRSRGGEGGGIDALNSCSTVMDKHNNNVATELMEKMLYDCKMSGDNIASMLLFLLLLLLLLLVLCCCCLYIFVVVAVVGTLSED